MIPTDVIARKREGNTPQPNGRIVHGDLFQKDDRG